MAPFCELAHDTFVADQSPADQAGAPTVAGEAGRNELKWRLEAGSFRLVQVFNKNQAFLAVREGHFAVLAFRGTEGKELLDTNHNLRLVPLPGISGVMVYCGFLEVFRRCKTEIEAAVNESVPSTLASTLQGIPSAVHSLRSRRLRSTGITSRRATPDQQLGPCPWPSTRVLPRLSPQWGPGALDAQNIVCTSPRPVRQLSLQYRRNSPRDTAHKQVPNQRRSHDLELSETA
jgi:hypothetical protein